MYRRILVPMDGSTLADRALGAAIPLAERHGARLILAQVYEPLPVMTLPSDGALRDAELERGWRQEQERSLERSVKRVRRQTTVDVEGCFRDGEVVATLAREVREQAVDLVVMCTHGRGGFQRLFLGSVADGLMRQLAVPLLLVRGARGNAAPKGTFERIVVPVDGSTRAEAALPAVAELLGTQAAVLTLAHVVHPMTAAAAEQQGRSPGRIFEVEYLEPLAARMRSATRTVQHRSVVDGNVARALIAIADAQDADLIALTTQGMGGFERFVVGSVADKLIRSAAQAVLICPAVA